MSREDGRSEGEKEGRPSRARARCLREREEASSETAIVVSTTPQLALLLASSHDVDLGDVDCPVLSSLQLTYALVTMADDNADMPPPAKRPPTFQRSLTVASEPLDGRFLHALSADLGDASACGRL